MENQNILSEQKKIAIADCAKWARILGIATIASIIISLASSLIQMSSSGIGIATVLASTLLGGSISIASAVLLIYFYKHATDGIASGSSFSMERSLYNFKWYFALLGILFIIGICFACIGGLVAGLASA